MATASGKLTRRLEDYLEAVWVLTQETGAARVRDIAARTDVTMPTVTSALRQLAQAGLVHYDPYQLVTLTDRGESAARRIRHKHEAITEFLVDVLDVSAETAAANACRMEHVVDDEVLTRLSLLAEFLCQHRPRGADWQERFEAFRRAHRHRADDPEAGGRP
jgi:DtxR family Mn-dependent transcriptional regulator